MARTVFVSRAEAPSLRRAELLLARVIQDSGDAAPEITALHAAVGEVRRAAESAHLVRTDAVEQLESALLRVVPPSTPLSGRGVTELLLGNALSDTRDIIRRIGGAHKTTPTLEEASERLHVRA